MAIEHVTPLYYWSQLSQAAAELNLAAGKALAFAMNGNEPYAADIANLRALLARANETLDKGERATASAPPEGKGETDGKAA